jgi:hypothetical protein
MRSGDGVWSDQAGYGQARLGSGPVGPAPRPLGLTLRPGQLAGQTQTPALLGVGQSLATMSTSKVFLK